MARIGVYGGTFNPIHNTHIGIAQAALTQYKLDKVYFLVAGTPPHKNTADGTLKISVLRKLVFKFNIRVFAVLRGIVLLLSKRHS